MRQIKTYILRLYTDIKIPERICGDLQALPERTAIPFKSYAELLNLLLQPTGEPATNISLKETQDDPSANLPNAKHIHE